ncbi:hypothetical protein [Methylobacterium sp. JK268]
MGTKRHPVRDPGLTGSPATDLARPIRRPLLALLALAALSESAAAADLLGPAYGAPTVLRYFPRGDDAVVRREPAPVPVVTCAPGGVVPTNSPLDPSYVGSSFGLGKPSYYGLTPPPGIDDPYGRRLRVCP